MERTVRTLADIYDDPVGAREEIIAAWMESLEDCGLAIHREPTMVKRKKLDYSSIETSDEE